VEEAEQGTPEKMQVGKDGKGGLLKPYSHKGISSQSRSLRRAAEQPLNRLAACVLFTDIFPLSTCFVHRVDAKPPVFREKTISSYFGTQ